MARNGLLGEWGPLQVVPSGRWQVKAEPKSVVVGTAAVAEETAAVAVKMIILPSLLEEGQQKGRWMMIDGPTRINDTCL